MITGANTGIGLETAKELARKGAEVYVLARTEAKGKAAVAEIKAAVAADIKQPKVSFMELDLSSFASIRAFAAAWKPSKDKAIDMLILNAGVMKSPGAQYVGKEMTYGWDKTKEGFEIHIGVNYIGHFYFTQLLKESLVKDSRVVVVSSAAEEGAPVDGIRFDMWKQESRHEEYEDGVAYGQSKLAGIFFAREAAARWKEAGVKAYSCHPGLIMSDLSRYMDEEGRKDDSTTRMIGGAMKKWFESIQFSRADGALTQLHLAVATDVVNGAYYTPIGTREPPRHPQGQNATLQKILWDNTLAVIEKEL